MISIFVGSDTKKTRTLFEKQVSIYAESGLKVVRYTDLDFNSDAATESLFAQDLFGGATVVAFDGLLDHPDSSEWYSPILATSPHHICIRELAPKKEMLELFQKIGKVEVCTEPKPTKSQPLTFVLADAVIARDKQRAFALYHQCVREGGVPEEIHGVLFWAIKSLFFVMLGNIDDAMVGGVGQYQYKKIVVHTKKWSIDEVALRIRMLKDMFHEAHHAKGVDLDIRIERMLLL
jgi:hypothetical protein